MKNYRTNDIVCHNSYAGMPHAPDQRASGCRKVLQELVPIPNRSFRHTVKHAEQIPYHFYVGKRKGVMHFLSVLCIVIYVLRTR